MTPVAELDGAGNVVSRFVYATGINVPDYLVKGDSTYRLVRDHLGSVRLVANVQSGTIAQRIDYDEFGVETQNTNPGFQPFGFAGGLVDASTGLVRFGVRDYLAPAGRWTAKDPIGFASNAANLYVYASSDPVNAIDPSGRIVPLLVAGGVLGGAVGLATYFLTTPREDWTLGGGFGAFAGGAVAGAIGVAATPIAASLSLGTGVLATAAVNFGGGVLGSLITAGYDPDQEATVCGLFWSGLGSSLGGAAGGRWFPTSGMSVFRQVGFPRTWAGVIPKVLGGTAGNNAMNAVYKASLPSGVGGLLPWIMQ